MSPIAWAKITHQFDDGAITELEVGTDDAAHPDLLDELVSRVCRLWREVTEAGAEDGEG